MPVEKCNFVRTAKKEGKTEKEQNDYGRLLVCAISQSKSIRFEGGRNSFVAEGIYSILSDDQHVVVVGNMVSPSP